MTGFQSYQTTPGVSLFNRTFGIDNYFHCKACKRLWLSVDNNNASDNITGPCYLQLDKDGNNFTSCSHLFLSNSVIFPGKLDNNTLVKSKSCTKWVYIVHAYLSILFSECGDLLLQSLHVKGCEIMCLLELVCKPPTR